MEMEAREKAAQMRISNFYRSGTGKMNPETFYCIKKKTRKQGNPLPGGQQNSHN
jgi:hypothetical protein